MADQNLTDRHRDHRRSFSAYSNRYFHDLYFSCIANQKRRVEGRAQNLVFLTTKKTSLTWGSI